MKILLTILILTLSTFAQLDYSPRASNKEAAVKMHFAIKLFRGVDAQQEQFLLRAIQDKRSVNEIQARELFTLSDLKDVFFAIGYADVTDYKRIYEKGSIPEKKAIYHGLTRAERDDLWRINFAWGVGYLNLNQVQTEYLLRFAKALPVTRDDLRIWEAEAVALFPKDKQMLLFGSIGPFTPCVSFTKIKRFGDCPCSIGSSFNMGCKDECVASGGNCTITPDGCGFAWGWSCDGSCTLKAYNEW